MKKIKYGTKQGYIERLKERINDIENESMLYYKLSHKEIKKQINQIIEIVEKTEKGMIYE